MSKLIVNEEQPLYLQTAERLIHMIEEGTFRVGERLPSVRALHREWGISISTAMEAYRQLENKGLIEARPQSGYYVLPRLVMSLSEPCSTPGNCKPRPVTESDLSLRIMEDSENPALINLAGAVPPACLMPVEKLNRTLSSVLRRQGNKSISYEYAAGLKSLRAEVAKRMTKAGCSITPDEVIITAGCLEAVFVSLMTCCKPGDTVVVDSPCYFWFLRLLAQLGLEALEIPTSPREGMSLEALRYALDRHRVSAVLTSPNFTNPLSSLMSVDRKKELVRICADREIPLIEDDIYGELNHRGDRPVAAKSFDKDDNVIFCSSISKTLATGWRLGWIIPGRRFETAIKMKAYMNVATNTPLQMALADFFETGGYDHHLRKYRRSLESRVRIGRDAVATYFPEGTKVTDPQGGFVLWVELPEEFKPLDIYEKAKKRGVVFAPGDVFTTGKTYASCLRLNCSIEESKQKIGIQIIGELLHDSLR